jgi:hypothetical protein
MGDQSEPWWFQSLDETELVTRQGPVIWSMLRRTVTKLGQDASEQIKDPDIDECFEWDPGYPTSWMCERAGWISPGLRTRLDAIDGLLARLSNNRNAWSDEAIMTLQLWEEVRQAARECLPLMTEEPWKT